VSPRRLRLLMNVWPPFVAAGIHVLSIAADWRHAKVRLRRRWYNQNYVGTHFGGSLFAMTDPFWMIMVMENLGRDYLVWDKAGAIEFVAALREPVFVEFRLDDAVLDALRAAAAGGEKVLHWFETEVRSADGQLAARVRKQVYVRLKKPRAATA
jgi:acyl-coenzyme A thioesterase PaaI-like protein